MSLDFHDLPLKAVREETSDSRSFVLEIPASLRPRFAYRAGQFLTFELPWDGFAIRRCYSLASSPEVDDELYVTVKRVAGGRMSNWMIDHLRAGSIVRVSPPDGRFVLEPDLRDVPLTLIGGGSGITPLISLLKTALASSARPVRLIYANRDRDGVIFQSELMELSRQYRGRLELHFHYDSDSGYLMGDEVRRLVRGHEQEAYYVCGPAPFMDTVARALEGSEVRSDRIFFERFVSPTDPDRREDSALPPLDIAPVPSSFGVKLSGRRTQVPYERGLTLLEAAQRSGVKAPSSCEDGYCGSCMAHLVKGSVAMRACKALSPAEVEQGKILLCQAVPTSADALEVDYDATSFRAQAATPAGRQQPLLPRVLTSILVVVIFVTFCVLRSTS